MKRGKRQVIQPQPQLQGSASQQQLEQSNNYFSTLSMNSHNVSSYQQQKSVLQSSQPTVTQSSIISPVQQNQTSHISQSQHQHHDQKVADDPEEKRKKIQLLKQKYLKKNKVEETVTPKIQPAISKTTTLSTFSAKHPQLQEVKQNQVNSIINNHIHNTVPQLQKIVKPSISILPKFQQKPNIQDLKPTETMNKNLPQQNNTSKQQYQQIQQTKNLITQSQQYQNQSEQVPTQSLSTVSHHLPHHEVPKPPTKHHFKNTPPPPHMKKNPPPLNNQQSKQTQNDQPQSQIRDFPQVQSITVNQQKTLEKQSPSLVPVLSTKPEVQSSNSSISKSQKQDNKSFAPPSTTASTDKFQTIEQNRVPPPPQNRNMKDLLNKKFSSNKNVPKPPQRIQHQQSNRQQNGFEQQINSEWGRNYPRQQNVNYNPQKHKNVQIDDQYNNTLPTFSGNGKQKSQLSTIPSKQINPENYVSQWLTNPEMTLKQLNPQMKQIIDSYFLNKNLQLNITSNNNSFNPMVKQLINQFVLNNSVSYTQQQKVVTQSMCLSYFYTNAAQFSDIFLIVLVKLGQRYLIKYKQALDDQFAKYLQRILLHKNILLPQEINQFVRFCNQQYMISESNLLLFLMLTRQSQQQLQFANQIEIHQLKNSISILTFCHLNIKNKNLLSLYLKTISALQPQWVKYKMVEKVLNHLKTIDIPQHLYQYTKQLKLKLLKNYENNDSRVNMSNSGNQSRGYYSNDSSNQPSYMATTQPQSNKDTGLFGLFNINKAIDKIKIQTEKALGAAVQKQKKPQQQQKKDQIIYDPIRKRYIINGQIPQDQNQPSKQQITEQKVKAPPPPPMAGRKPPPPMPGKKPGARIITNRYA